MSNLLDLGLIRMAPHPDRPDQVMLDSRPLMALLAQYGPRVTTAGRQLTSRQGLGDWYPPWIGVPETSIGALVRSPEEAREEIRLQVKDGVDIIKIDLDGTQANPRTGHLMACFDQAEAAAMVAEAQRLGRRVFVHAVDREAVLYAARAGADVIFHAFDMDDECLEAIVRNGWPLIDTIRSFTCIPALAAGPVELNSTIRMPRPSSCRSSATRPR